MGISTEVVSQKGLEVFLLLNFLGGFFWGNWWCWCWRCCCFAGCWCFAGFWRWWLFRRRRFGRRRLRLLLRGGVVGGVPFFLFTGHFRPATIVRFLDLTRRLDFCFIRWLVDISGISGLVVLQGADFCDVAELLTTPAVRLSVLYHYHHLPIPTDYRIRDGLEALSCISGIRSCRMQSRRRASVEILPQCLS